MKNRSLIFYITFIILGILFCLYFNNNYFIKAQSKSFPKEVVNLNLTTKDSLQIPNDFQIGGLKLDCKISDITKILGKPRKKYEWKKGEAEYYEYSGIRIGYSLITKDVLSILVQKTGLKTYRGISINDKEENVFYRYGKVEPIENILTYEKYIMKNYEDHTYAISFTIKNGIVKQIEVYFGGD